MTGGNGGDELDGGAGADIISGGYGDDVIAAGDGLDYVQGGGGNDVVHLGAGNDWLYAYDDFGRGDDLVFGVAGHDTLEGGRGNDRLDGGAGNDLLVGGAGEDVLAGGAGADVFAIRAGGGHDTITDFGPEDRLQVTREVNGGRLESLRDSSVSIEYRGGDGWIDFGNGVTVRLVGVRRRRCRTSSTTRSGCSDPLRSRVRRCLAGACPSPPTIRPIRSRRRSPRRRAPWRASAELTVAFSVDPPGCSAGTRCGCRR